MDLEQTNYLPVGLRILIEGMEPSTGLTFCISSAQSLEKDLSNSSGMSNFRRKIGGSTRNLKKIDKNFQNLAKDQTQTADCDFSKMRKHAVTS